MKINRKAQCSIIGNPMDNFLSYVAKLEGAFNSLLYKGIIIRLFRSRLELVSVLHRTCPIIGYLGVIFFLYGIFAWKPNGVNSAGLCLDIIGTIRLFLNEEWERILENYHDEQKYPYGPPSYIMREYFEFDNPDPEWVGQSNEKIQDFELARYIYWIRGLVFLVLGFVLQLLSSWMG